ncbi:MAG: dehalogenase [Candidatus Latescibacterota bacterium]|nr:MAG: dehalogenase [Candidatus Latescibacterota bacterium]
MAFFTGGLFWFIEGVLACLAVVAIKIWTQDRGIAMPWWKWLLTALWFCLAGFTLAMIGTSLGEGEPRAAVMGGVVFGVVTVVTGVAFWRVLGFSRAQPKTNDHA